MKPFKTPKILSSFMPFLFELFLTFLIFSGALQAGLIPVANSRNIFLEPAIFYSPQKSCSRRLSPDGPNIETLAFDNLKRPISLTNNHAYTQLSIPPKTRSSYPPKNQNSKRQNIRPAVNNLGQTPENSLSNTSQSESPVSNNSLDNPGEEEKALRQKAYEQSLLELLPADPEEISALRQKADNREKALSDVPVEKIRTRTERLKLEPGFIPPTVSLTPNLVTALVFLDSTGSPFPITSTILGNTSLFKTELISSDPPNKIVVSSLANHGQSNLIITLANLELPLVIRLETTSTINEQRKIDGLIIYQIQSQGPLAKLESLPPLSATVEDLFYSILDGLKPPGVVRLSSQPQIPETAVFQKDEDIYVRTLAKLLWPAHTGKVEGIGGYCVYKIPAVSSLILEQDQQILRLFLDDALLKPEVL